MQLEELLEAEGLDADATQRTLEWARARAVEIVAAMPAGMEVSSLLENLPNFDAGGHDAGVAEPIAKPRQEVSDASSSDIAAEVEAGFDELGIGAEPGPAEDEAELPPPPDHDDSKAVAPDMLAGVPDSGALEPLHSGEIEMLDDDELELVEDGESDEDLDSSTIAARSVEAGTPESVAEETDEPATVDSLDGDLDDDMALDLEVDLSDLDDL